MQPQFCLSNLEAFVGVFNKGGNMLVQNLMNKIGERSTVSITTLVNETVFSILTGKYSNIEINKKMIFVEAILGVPMGSALAATYRRDSPYRQ